ncbi:uncharacterized protein EV420DRAFT_1548802 [Desarmillaria tabescens]|uniref:DUF6534 domain-containing protein n=1 Tax=Armillaria tabescens TaxID=1929756 RepID=A0AA39KB00_ARMTA|nr:uncharacterized protein EV420DRAFT_1548802 [Desarmillaria tabescens]KAK0457523.1 hypothetical protein EV420DRAFT_1548802 [Desarmillaria tabescens]
MMSYYLHKSGEATMFSTTASLIFGLMRLVVASGIATSACSLLALISFIVWPKTLIFLGIDFVLPKLYVNSLLAMFNYRREHLEPHQSDAERGGNSFPTFLHIIPHSSEGSSAQVNINIPLTETERFRSLDDKSDHSKGASLAFE